MRDIFLTLIILIFTLPTVAAAPKLESGYYKYTNSNCSKTNNAKVVWLDNDYNTLKITFEFWEEQIVYIFNCNTSNTCTLRTGPMTLTWNKNNSFRMQNLGYGDCWWDYNKAE